MASLQYKGRQPNADFSVVHKHYVDAVYAATKVDLAFINQTVAHETDGLATEMFVAGMDKERAQKTTVDVADNKYLLRSELGQPNGLAVLGATGRVSPAALPNLQTQRKVMFKNADTLALTGTQTRELAVQNNPRDFELGSLTITDPGFPYVPLLFATVTGGSAAGVQGTAAMGTGSFAQLSIQRTDLIKYSYTLTSSQKNYETFLVLPIADVSNSSAPISGGHTFKLWAGLDSRGTTYTISAVGLSFYAIILPGI